MGIIVPDNHCDKETKLNIGLRQTVASFLIIIFFIYGLPMISFFIYKFLEFFEPSALTIPNYYEDSEYFH